MTPRLCRICERELALHTLGDLAVCETEHRRRIVLEVLEAKIAQQRAVYERTLEKRP